MKHQLNLRYSWTGTPIQHTDQLTLMGSCFTTHMGNALDERGFRTLSNPTGILFDPTAICRHLHKAFGSLDVEEDELFLLNECYSHWDFHSDFSFTEKLESLHAINSALQRTQDALMQSSWLVLTLGSAFRYVRKTTGQPVANNHRAPADGFRKELLEVTQIVDAIKSTLALLRSRNPGLQLLLTVSPVRHIRDGVVENNRSKARLIEAVHQIVEQVPQSYYFPAYELVTDVLRDYRWYDIDLVHPNFAATSYVFEQFEQLCMTAETRKLNDEVYQLTLARRHRPRFPETTAHRKFLAETAARETALQKQLPWL
jgi:hypothetical protein